MHQSHPLGMKAGPGTKDATPSSNEFFAGQFGQVWSKAIPFNRETVMQWEKSYYRIGPAKSQPFQCHWQKESRTWSWQLCSNSFTSNAMLSASVLAPFNAAFCIFLLLTYTRTAFVFCFVFVFVLPHTGTAPPNLLCGLPIFCWSSTSPAWRGSCKEKRLS